MISPTTPELNQGSFPMTPVQKNEQNQNQLSTPITPTHKRFQEPLPPCKTTIQEELALAKYQVDDVAIGRQLGHGSNAKVFECNLNGQLTVIKTPLNPRKSKILKREALILSKLHSPSIVTLYGVQDTDLFSIILEKMEIDLHSYLDTALNTARTDHMLTTDLVIGDYWFSLYNSLIKGLQYLEECHVIHCDLKSCNILLNTTDMTFKICDFSSAKFEGEVSNNPETTLQFLAPELLNLSNKSNHNYSTDLYSLGLILLHAATGRQPYEGFLTQGLTRLIHLIKENSVFKVLDSQSSAILQQNPDVLEILNKILIQRFDLLML